MGEVCTKSEYRTKANAQRYETPDISVENPNVGKTTATQRLQKITLYVRDTTSREHRGNDLLSSSSLHAAAVTLWRQRPLSRSLSLSLTLCTTTFTIMQQHYLTLCPKSYLYIYDFSTYLHLCPSNRSVPIGAGSMMSRFSASSIRFHPEGHVSQHDHTQQGAADQWRQLSVH